MPTYQSSLMLLALCAMLPSVAATQATAPSATAEIPELETFVVTGEQPGPALWKVTRKDHALWILPTFGPLPARLVWRSSEVEAVIRESQEIYAEARIPLQRPTDAKSQQRLWKAVTNENGKLLRQVMPADLYAQFSDLSRRYAGDTRMFELFRPFQATDMLKDAAMERLQLTSDGGIPDTVENLASRYGVRFLGFEELDTRAWDKLVAQLEKTPREADLACTKARLDRLDSDLRKAVDRSNAWARGDIPALRADAGLQTDGADIKVCRQFFQHMAFVRETIAAMRKKNYATYRQALKKNRSTLILVPIDEMFAANGLIAKLRKDGYEVEEP